MSAARRRAQAEIWLPPWSLRMNNTTKIAQMSIYAFGHGDVHQVGGPCWRGSWKRRAHTARSHLLRLRRREGAVRPADTLFSDRLAGGVFEGTYPMMWDLASEVAGRCPDDFKLQLRAMNITASNIKFRADRRT